MIVVQIMNIIDYFGHIRKCPFFISTLNEVRQIFNVDCDWLFCDQDFDCYWWLVIFFWIFYFTDQRQHGFHCLRRKVFCFNSVLLRVLPKNCTFILKAHSQNLLCFWRIWFRHTYNFNNFREMKSTTVLLSVGVLLLTLQLICEF